MKRLFFQSLLLTVATFFIVLSTTLQASAQGLSQISGTMIVENPGSENCTLNAGEAGLNPNPFGATITLTGATTASDTTDNQGRYSFSVAPGGYNLRAFLPPGGTYRHSTCANSNQRSTTVPPNRVFNFWVVATNVTPPPVTPPPGTTGNIINLNFAIANVEPWMRFYGSDVRFDAGFRNPMPPAPSCGGGFTMLPGSSTTSGVFFTGNSTSNFGGGAVSNTGWIVGGTNYSERFTTPAAGKRTSYDFMTATLRQSGITPTSLPCTLNNCTLPANLANGVYLANGNLRIVNPNYSFPANSDYVILVNGSLTLEGRINVPVGSTATFSMNGGMTIAATVGAPPACPPTSVVEGFYSADENIIFEGINDCTIDADLALGLEGSFVANAGNGGGTVQNQRNLCEDNTNFPTVSVRERPDIILNAPDLLKVQTYTFQEVAP